MKIVHEDKNQSSIQKLSKIVKDVISYILALVLIWLIYIEVSKNYCFEQHRELTDKEYISIVLNSLLESGQMQSHSWDNTVESYLAHHPHCCRVFRSGSFYDGAPVVDITYEMSDELKKQTSKSGRATHYQSLTVMTGCGKSFDSTGEAITSPKNEVHSIN